MPGPQLNQLPPLLLPTTGTLPSNGPQLDKAWQAVLVKKAKAWP